MGGSKERRAYVVAVCIPRFTSRMETRLTGVCEQCGEKTCDHYPAPLVKRYNRKPPYGDRRMMRLTYIDEMAVVHLERRFVSKKRERVCEKTSHSHGVSSARVWADRQVRESEMRAQCEMRMIVRETARRKRRISTKQRDFLDLLYVT